MATVIGANNTAGIVDKEAMRKVMEALHAELGIQPGPIPSAREIREQMIREGVRPEDNIASREIIAMRNREE